MTKKKNVLITKVLVRALALLSKPGGWIKGKSAADKDGKHVVISDPDACGFCVVAGIYRATQDILGKSATFDARYQLRSDVLRLLNGDFLEGVPFWNDAKERTKDHVLMALEFGIESLKP